MTGYKWFVFGIAFRALLGSSPLMAGPIDWGRHPYPETARAVHEAEHAVDYAWEMYHRAALGGTQGCSWTSKNTYTKQERSSCKYTRPLSGGICDRWSALSVKSTFIRP
jgi:hypothetical protein